jgi:hypothetical protein
MMKEFSATGAATGAVLKAETILVSKGNRQRAEAWLFDNTAWERDCLHAWYARYWRLPR